MERIPRKSSFSAGGIAYTFGSTDCLFETNNLQPQPFFSTGTLSIERD